MFSMYLRILLGIGCAALLLGAHAPVAAQTDHRPAIIPINAGTAIRNNAGTTQLIHSIAIRDLDGANATSGHTVSVTYPNGTVRNLVFDSQINVDVCDFFISENLGAAQAPAGTYTYVATDSGGRQSVPYTEEFNETRVLPAMDPSLITVQEQGTTPLISWPVIQDAVYYRVRLYNAGNQTVYEAKTADTQLRVESGFLAGATPYRVRLEAYGDHQGFDQNTFSRSPFTADFTTGGVTSDPSVRLPKDSGVKFVRDHMGSYVVITGRACDADGVDTLRSAGVIFPGESTERNLVFDQDSISGNCVDFSGQFPGPIATGTYQVAAHDDQGLTGQDSVAIASAVMPFAPLNGTEVTPESGTLITEDEFTLSWPAVNGAQAYKITATDRTSSQFMTLNFYLPAADTSLTLPAAMFDYGGRMGFTVSALSDFLENSPMAAALLTRNEVNPQLVFDRPTPPASNATISGDGRGVVFYAFPARDGAGLWRGVQVDARVTHDAGVPQAIKSVTVTYPGGETRSLSFVSCFDLNPDPVCTDGRFLDMNLLGNATLVSGTYTLTVEEFDNSTQTVTDDVTFVNMTLPEFIRPVDGGRLSADDSVTWTPVPQAAWYSGELFGDPSYVKYFTVLNQPSMDLNGTGVTLGSTYFPRITAYDVVANPPVADVDNAIQIPLYTNQHSFRVNGASSLAYLLLLL